MPHLVNLHPYQLLQMEMEHFFSSNNASLIFSFLLFLFSSTWILTLLFSSNKKRKLGKPAPRAGGAWPIIGQLHLLVGPELPHVILGRLADKYGSIFTIMLGSHPALIVSDSKIAKECFTTNEHVFSTRPKAIAVELMGYNYAMYGLGPYGRYWRAVYKIIMRDLLSNRQIEKLGHIRVYEVKETIKEIHQFWLKNTKEKSGEGNISNMVKMEMTELFGRLSINIVVRTLAGKRYSIDDKDGEGARSKKAIKMFMTLLGTFVVSDAIPYVRWLDLGGHEKAMRNVAKEIDYILQGWLDEHKQKRERKGKSEGEQDFMDTMLANLEGKDASLKDFAGFDADTTNKATCLTFLSGATDTSTGTLTWALSLLVNNPDKLKKAQEELDLHVGRNRQVEESDLENLVYIQAIVKETLRLYPAGQLLAPRESVEDCVIGGYHIPKGTRLILNLSKIHRDPSVWSDPNEFQPERFFSTHKHIDIRGQSFELLPFGTGRRICPGMFFGLQVLHLALASLIHEFEFTTLGEPVDMSLSNGLSNHKATPLEVYLAPRLHSH